MKKVQRGFSLIELMIVVAIIGVLAAVAMPAYQNYQVRAQVSDGISLASTFKLQIAEYYATNGALPPDATYTSQTSRYATADQDANGVLTITYINAAPTSTEIRNDVITITPSVAAGTGTMVWTCASAATATGVKADYCPSSCACAGT